MKSLSWRIHRPHIPQYFWPHLSIYLLCSSLSFLPLKTLSILKPYPSLSNNPTWTDLQLLRVLHQHNAYNSKTIISTPWFSSPRLNIPCRTQDLHRIDSQFCNLSILFNLIPQLQLIDVGLFIFPTSKLSETLSLAFLLYGHPFKTNISHTL